MSGAVAPSGGRSLSEILAVGPFAFAIPDRAVSSSGLQCADRGELCIVRPALVRIGIVRVSENGGEIRHWNVDRSHGATERAICSTLCTGTLNDPRGTESELCETKRVQLSVGTDDAETRSNTTEKARGRRGTPCCRSPTRSTSTTRTTSPPEKRTAPKAKSEGAGAEPGYTGDIAKSTEILFAVGICVCGRDTESIEVIGRDVLESTAGIGTGDSLKDGKSPWITV